ncbi:MAG: peptidylprolyl isomerase [Formivibrio sp.]|nr:peptidylprolyl isomerase [Formivibrio sp.]
MTILVNGVEITDEAIARELPGHHQAPDPLDAARQTLVLRELLLQAADNLGIQAATPDETIASLMEQKIHAEQPDEAACRAFFEENQDSFERDEVIDAHHILFRAENGEDAQVLRTTAELVLAQVQMNPERFEELARAHSGCPSGEEGGSLGQIARGQTVPEFEQALFALGENQVHDQLVETQFGLHIVKSGARSAPAPVTFAEAHSHIVRFLTDMRVNDALHAYLKELAAAATIEGYTLPL